MNGFVGESGDTVNHEECGSHFEQAEEEEDMSIGVKNPPMVFKVNRYSHNSKSSGRRGITWYQNDVTPKSKQKTTEEGKGKRFSIGISVTENLNFLLELYYLCYGGVPKSSFFRKLISGFIDDCCLIVSRSYTVGGSKSLRVFLVSPAKEQMLNQFTSTSLLK